MGIARRGTGLARLLVLLCLLALLVPRQQASRVLAAPLQDGGPLQHVETLGGNINALQAHDGLLYAAEGVGLSIFNVANPAQPARLGRVELGGITSDLRLQGALAYVAMREAGLAIVDISQPASPRLLATHASPNQTEVLSVDVAGTLAVLVYHGTRPGSSPGQRPTHYGGLQTLDISDPARPRVLGTLEGSSVGSHVRLGGATAYVAAGQWGLEAFDISNPASPRKYDGEIRYSNTGRLAISGTRLYLVSNTSGVGYLNVLDISTAGQPALLASYQDPQWGLFSTYQDLAVSGQHVYVTGSEGLFIVDVQSPTSPTTVGRLSTNRGYLSSIFSIALDAGFAYVELQYTGLGVVDVRDQARPALAATYDTPIFSHLVEVRGTLAYSAAGGYGLQILDLAGPQRPRVLGSVVLSDPMNQSIWDMAVAGTIIYMQVDSRLLQVVDVADPAHPRLLASYRTVEEARYIELVGTRLYVGGALQLEIVDVSNPGAPTRIATYRHGGTGVDSLVGLEVAGNAAFLLQAFQQIDIVDVSNPAAPQRLSRIEGEAIQVVGERAYVGKGAELRIYSLGNLAAPRLLGSTALANRIVKFTVAGSLAYMMTTFQDSSLELVDVADSARPRQVGSYDLLVEGGPIVVAGEELFVPEAGIRHLRLITAQLPPVEYADQRCFAETGQCLGGPLRAYWEQQGGLPVFGFPLGPARHELNRDLNMVFATQWLERNRLELHPENRAPYDVLLGRLGDELLKRQGRDWQSLPRAAGPQDGCLWFVETQHNVCDQAGAPSGSLGFKRYWQSHGLEFDGQAGTSYAESLALFGLPLTEPQLETNSSGDTVLTQWFERARFEWHPGNPDEYKVLLGRLGAEARQ